MQLTEDNTEAARETCSTIAIVFALNDGLVFGTEIGEIENKIGLKQNFNGNSLNGFGQMLDVFCNKVIAA